MVKGISNSTSITIGLATVLLIGTFYLGVSYSNINTRMYFLEQNVEEMKKNIKEINEKI